VKNSVGEIMNHIFQHVQDEDDVVFYEDRITTALLAAGYDNEEVRASFLWLKKMNLGDGAEFSESGSSRSFVSSAASKRDRGDRLYMSPEAYGLLRKLDQNGIIDGRIHESILDLAIQLPIDEISVGTVKTLTAIVLLLKHHNHAEERLLGMEGVEEGELLH